MTIEQISDAAKQLKKKYDETDPERLADLPDVLQKVVLAHELGHCVLHSGSSSAAFHEVTLFDTADRKEYEANVFASELLLTDEAVLAALNDDMFFFQAAKALYVPSELLDFKFRILKRRGYKVESPITANGDFLKNLEKERLLQQNFKNF